MEIDVSANVSCRIHRYPRTSSVTRSQNDIRFPQSVKVNLSIINKNQDDGLVSDVSKRSTSPWDYSVNEDPNRFPARISEATCRRPFCVDSRGKENYSMNSVPIRQEILVLRRRFRGCEQTYQLEKQWVTVGCTCARALSNTSA
ncbi:interleukin-17F-like [Heteronotia binoei]|uniref:interleukin-17F-like n=1 Tax=Heteronotia binoei TaxID=13085 RepID=UPI00292FBE7C|nr:interleukin-17F-like [Heteronotia binoei]